VETEAQSGPPGVHGMLPERPRRLGPEEIDEVFAGVVDAGHRQILAMVYSITGDFHAAEEVTQDAFLKLHDHLHRKRVDRRLISWLRSVARNAALDLLRAQRRNPGTVPLEEVREAADAPAVQPDQRELAGHVSRILTKLPKRKRLIFEMRAIDNLPYYDIALAAGCSSAAAMKEFERTATQIRRTLRRENASGDATGKEHASGQAVAPVSAPDVPGPSREADARPRQTVENAPLP